MASAQKTRAAIGKSGSSVPVRVAIFLVIALSIFGVVHSQIEDLEVAEVSPYFFVAIVVQVFPFILKSDSDPFQPSALTAFFHLVALVPTFTMFIVQHGLSLTLLPHVTGRTRIELVQTVLVAYTLGTFGYFAGYYFGPGRRLQVIFPSIAGMEWKRSRLLIVTAVCMAFFIPAYAYFQSRVGAGITDITQLGAGKAVWREDTSMSWLFRAVGIGAIPPLLYIALHYQKPNLRGMILTALFFFIIGFLTTRLGQRAYIIYLAFNALIVVHYLWRRVPIPLIAGGALIALILSNILGSYRKPDAQVRGPANIMNVNAADALVEHEDDRLRFSAMAVLFHYFPDRRDYVLGESWAMLAVWFVPRWFWPEKAKTFVWRDTNIVPELTGVSVPTTFLGLLYVNFSWVGIVLGMGFWGMFQRGLYEWLVRNQKDKNVVLIYSLTVMYFQPTTIQMAAAVGYLLPAYVAIRFMSTRLRGKAIVGRKTVPLLPSVSSPPEPAAGPAAE